MKRRDMLVTIQPGQEQVLGVPAGTEAALLSCGDNFNTEVAESTFSAMSGIRHTLRSLTAVRSERLCGLWVDAYNERTLRRRAGWHVPSAAPLAPQRRWDPLHHFRRDTVPPLLT